MTYLYLLSLLTLVAYIGYALEVCGLPASLSDTYYILKEKSRPSWLFQLAMVLCPMLLVPVWLELSSESVQFLSFLACGLYFPACGIYLPLSSLCRALSCCSRKSGCSGWKWRCLRVLILDCWLK